MPQFDLRRSSGPLVHRPLVGYLICQQARELRNRLDARRDALFLPTRVDDTLVKVRTLDHDSSRRHHENVSRSDSVSSAIGESDRMSIALNVLQLFPPE